MRARSSPRSARALGRGDQPLLALRRLALVERRLVAVQGEPQQALHVRQQRAGGAQPFGVALVDQAGRRRPAQHLGGMGIEQVGPLGGVAQRQVLGDEVDVEQAAAAGA